VLNSLAAAAVARWLGHDAHEAARTLKDFGACRRRFQLKGERAEVRVVDDYATTRPSSRDADAARSTVSIESV
jgi:UDP-N-acetylmuramate--alanine ligase